jgi:putative oxidoreductase
MLSKLFKKAHELAPLVIRIALSVVFFAHGSQKLFGAFGGHGINGVIGMMTHLKVYPPVVWAWVLSLTEFFGSLAIFFGILTRWAALGLAIDMGMAIHLVLFKNGFFARNGGFELEMTLFTMALSLLFMGPGKISLEGAFGKELS